MSIHAEHPFLPAEGDRSSTRRLRGRLVAPVTVWTTDGLRGRPVGWTVSSVLVADGEPAELLGLLDPEADLTGALLGSRVAAVSVLGGEHQGLADAFAGLAPAPGGAFRLGAWTPTAWGPVLSDASAWAGVRLRDGEPETVGWSLLVRAVIEEVGIGPASADGGASGALAHLRGRYHAVG